MRTTAFISQSALAHNLALVRRLCPHSKIVAILKNNAYGHQFECISPLIERADFLALSHLSDCAQLRAITERPILLLAGVYNARELQQASALNCHIVVHSMMQIGLIIHTKTPLNIWLKLDTGMHRLGFLAAEYRTCLAEISKNPLLKIICTMSHFGCADTPKHPLNDLQLTQFIQRTEGQNSPRSMANSAAILTQSSALFEFVRPGIMLYGISPFGKSDPNLKAVMTLTAPIIAIKTLAAGDSVGYGAIWTATQKTTIALVNIGYGDGYPRHAKNGTPVLINGVLCPLIGRVSMDSICVDISKINLENNLKNNVKINDRAILWGDEKLPVETVARWSDTLAYELITGLSARIRFAKSA